MIIMIEMNKYYLYLYYRINDLLYVIKSHCFSIL
jgi:hypothetical protein